MGKAKNLISRQRGANLAVPTASLAERPRGINPNVAPSGAIPIRELLHMQSMCDQGKTDSEIAVALGLDLTKVASIISDEGWRIPQGETEALKAKETAFQIRWKRAVAAQARWLSLRGMDLAAKKILAEDAMGFALSARGTKAFVDMALHANGEQAASVAPSSVNLFFFAGDAKPVKNANPVSRSKPLDVEAKPVHADAVVAQG